MSSYIDHINEHKKVFNSLNLFEKEILAISKILKKAIKSNTIFFCGNGGSASDSNHLCAELIGRFKSNRSPYSAISLSSNPANLTCIANDFGYENVFSRQLNGLGSKNDVLFVLTTSGNSENVYNAIIEAKKIGITTIGFLGKNGGKCKDLCDIEIIIESDNTARIQECHMFLGHFLCSLID